MSSVLTEENSEAFRLRFYEFFDAVVRQVSVTSRSRTMNWECHIDIEAQDSTTGGWALVSLQLEEVLEFTFSKGKSSYAVLSSGLQLFWSPERLLLVLDAYPDDPGIPDLSRNLAFVACRRCSWTVTAIPTS